MYASPIPSRRSELWRRLCMLGRSICNPWCIGGDLNATILSSERRPIRDVVV